MKKLANLASVFCPQVDEAIDTMKRGEESTATKLDDDVDELKE